MPAIPPPGRPAPPPVRCKHPDFSTSNEARSPGGEASDECNSEGHCFLIKRIVGSPEHHHSKRGEQRAPIANRQTPSATIRAMSKVLLVADASWVKNQVAAALSDSGTEVREVDDPRAAADEVIEFAPDVIIIDMQIGSMGGMAVARAVREVEYANDLADIPLVLLLDRAADAFLAKRASAHAWLTKPITAQDLRATLERVQGAGAVR